jgi:hypothetical protein
MSLTTPLHLISLSFNLWVSPCHGPCCKLPDFHRGGPVLIPVHCTCDLWWAERQWKSTSVFRCIRHPTTFHRLLISERHADESWEPTNKAVLISISGNIDYEKHFHLGVWGLGFLTAINADWLPRRTNDLSLALLQRDICDLPVTLSCGFRILNLSPRGIQWRAPHNVYKEETIEASCILTAT